MTNYRDFKLITLEEMVKEFLTLLNRVEESDSGKIFRPNMINSCRVMDGIRIGELLKQMEEKVGYGT